MVRKNLAEKSSLKEVDISAHNVLTCEDLMCHKEQSRSSLAYIRYWVLQNLSSEKDPIVTIGYVSTSSSSLIAVLSNQALVVHADTRYEFAEAIMRIGFCGLPIPGHLNPMTRLAGMAREWRLITAKFSTALASGVNALSLPAEAQNASQEISWPRGAGAPPERPSYLRPFTSRRKIWQRY